MNVFFVCGAPKSGTTWLQRVLDAHPEVACSGEGHFIDRFTVPLAQVVRDYNSHVILVADRVYEGKPYYQPMNQQDYDRLARSFILDRLMSVNPGPQVTWVGDKTPRYTHHLPQLYRLFPEAKFINIVRDPRDVAMSRLGHAVRAGVSEAMTPGGAGREGVIRSGAEDWVNNLKAIGPFSAAHPGAMHRLRYEDMLADPAGEARRMFGFLGVSTKDAVIDSIVAETSFEAQSGRQRGEEQIGSFLRKGVAGDWVGRLEPWAQQLLEETCGPLMRENGYL